MATNSSEIWGGLVGNGSNTDATSYAASSASPINGQVLLAAVASLKATAPDTPTASGTGGLNGTWTRIGSTVTIQTPAGNFIGLTVFWSVATSGTSGVLTFSFGAATQLAAVWNVVTSPFVNITTPIVQSKTTTDTSAGTTLSLSLDSALSSVMNWVVAVFAQQAAAAPTPTTLSNNEYSPSPAPSNKTASDGLGLTILVGPSITAAVQSLTASVGKIAFVMELAQDGTGVPSGGLVNAGTLSGGLE